MNYNPPTYDKKWVDNFVGCKIDANVSTFAAMYRDFTFCKV